MYLSKPIELYHQKYTLCELWALFDYDVSIGILVVIKMCVSP